MTINIGQRRELFIDDWLIEKLQGANVQLQKPERREIAFTMDAPWEDCVAFPSRVLPWDGGWRLYYRASVLDWKRENETCVIALAESRDGLAFTRPELGLCEFRGATRNNILLSGVSSSGLTPFLDANPACPPDQRVKGFTCRFPIVAGTMRGEIYAMSSPDGRHWSQMRETPLELPGHFDSVNTAFWDSLAGCYRCFTRSFHDLTTGRVLRDGWNFGKAKLVRAIQHATSPDFIHWSAPEQLQYADGDQATQLYTNAIIPCPGAEHIFLGFPNRFLEERKTDPAHPAAGVNDALFMTSRDGVHWTRRLEAWVGPGLDPLNWTDRNNYPIWGIAETSPSEWSLYITEHYRHQGVPVRLRRLPIRPWGFVAVHAEHQGELLTKPFLFSGSRLRLNARTSAAGSIQVEIQDENGQARPGFARNDMTPWFGDALEAPMAWKQTADLSRLAGRPVRLRFSLKDADLFALQFGN